jgi:glycerol-3-phosphate dehydrogenase
VVGGGATGLGVALDAALRGHSVLLVEAHDFAKGTSSRATKLVHGGVRYLAQGDIHLVREALHERVHILDSAPHLAQPLAFVMPSYKLWETPFYGVGLKMYDLLAGRAGLGATQWLGAGQTQRLLPGVQPQGLKGGVKYWDGQFDDARLALALARTAAAQGALLLNTARRWRCCTTPARPWACACAMPKAGANGVQAGSSTPPACGWTPCASRTRNRPGKPAPMVAPSQGVHVVVDQSFLPGEHALLVPRRATAACCLPCPGWASSLGTTDTRATCRWSRARRRPSWTSS